MNLNSQSTPPLVLAALLLAQAILGYWQTATATPAIDFFGVWSVPHALAVRPVANIYSPDGQRAMAEVVRTEAAAPGSSERVRNGAASFSELYDNRIDSTGSPLLFTVVGLASTGNYDEDVQRFAFVSLICVIAAIVLACRLLQFSPLSTILMLIFVTSASAPVFSDINVGNFNQLQLFIVTLFIFFMARSKRFAAGLVLGFGIMLKPNLAFIAMPLTMLCVIDRAFKRQLKTYLGIGVAAMMCFVASSLYFGAAGVWLEFAKTLPRTLSLSYRFEDGNLGLSMLVFHLSGLHASTFLLIGLLGTFAYVAFRTRRRVASDADQRSLHEAFAVAGLGCAAMLLSSNLVWLHYYVLVIPLVLYTMRGDPPVMSSPAQHPVRWAAFAGAVLLMISPLGFLAASWTSQSMMVESFMLNGATLLTAAVTLYRMSGYRQAQTFIVAGQSKRTPAAAGARG